MHLQKDTPLTPPKKEGRSGGLGESRRCRHERRQPLRIPHTQGCPLWCSAAGTGPAACFAPASVHAGCLVVALFVLLLCEAPRARDWGASLPPLPSRRGGRSPQLLVGVCWGGTARCAPWPRGPRPLHPWGQLEEKITKATVVAACPAAACGWRGHEAEGAPGQVEVCPAIIKCIHACTCTCPPTIHAHPPPRTGRRTRGGGHTQQQQQQEAATATQTRTSCGLIGQTGHPIRHTQPQPHHQHHHPHPRGQFDRNEKEHCGQLPKEIVFFVDVSAARLLGQQQQQQHTPQGGASLLHPPLPSD